MDAVPFPEIETEYDELVASSAAKIGADPVCSTSRWIVPAAAAFASEADPRVFRGDNGMAVLLEHVNPNGPVLTSFDCVWGFATPFVGPDPVKLIDEVVADLLPRLDYYAMSIAGIDPTSPLFEELQRLAPVGYTDTADRCVGDLSDGFEAWMGRRSSRFRRSLRAAANRGEATGISVEHLSPTGTAEATAALERVLAIEKLSWKTEADSGLIDTDLGFFTRSMCQRFARTGDLRVSFARLDGVDVGYVIGGIVGDRYRGFQHSFDQRLAELSIGKLLQFHHISTLAAEGVAAYDLGMHMAYKESYADRIESTISLIFADRGHS